MPRGKRMSFTEFMKRMEMYYPDLRYHRKTCRVVDGRFCGQCIRHMTRSADRARYLGKVDLATLCRSTGDQTLTTLTVA